MFEKRILSTFFWDAKAMQKIPKFFGQTKCNCVTKKIDFPMRSHGYVGRAN